MRMSRRKLALLAPLTLVLAAACSSADAPTAPSPAAPKAAVLAAAPVCIQFNVPPLGTTWNAPGFPPGSFLFTEVGVPVFSERLLLPGPVPVYSFGRVEIPPIAIGAGPTGRAERFSYVVDFSNVPFPITSVTFEWLDLGGVENLAVNGSPVFIGELDTPPAFIGAFPVNSAWVAVPGGDKGRTRIGGNARRVLIGGEKLWVDNICANP